MWLHITRVVDMKYELTDTTLGNGTIKMISNSSCLLLLFEKKWIQIHLYCVTIRHVDFCLVTGIVTIWTSFHWNWKMNNQSTISLNKPTVNIYKIWVYTYYLSRNYRELRTGWYLKNKIQFWRNVHPASATQLLHPTMHENLFLSNT